MDFNQISYVVEIVEAGSISQASKNLFISQPNLSKQINKLEHELGKKIFERTNKGVKLTAFGRDIYHDAKALLEQFWVLEKKVSFKVNQNKIKVASFGSEIINYRFFEVCSKYDQSNYEFLLHECGTEEAIEKVVSKDCDIGIILFSDAQQNKLSQYVEAHGLEYRTLFTGTAKIHISCDNPLSRKKLLKKADLASLHLVKKSYLYRGMFSFDQEMHTLGIPEATKTIFANSNQIYNDALTHLSSYAVEIDWQCKYKIDSPFARVPFSGPPLAIHCAMVKRKNETLKEELDYFAQRLIDSYR
ncbi:LysR family transcriptional regulator [Fusibacter sp. JL298sf-3]